MGRGIDKPIYFDSTVISYGAVADQMWFTYTKAAGGPVNMGHKSYAETYRLLNRDLV